MLIDIEIKIADSNGNVLQRFEKRFDENDTEFEKLTSGTKLGTSFEDFLSEYMSLSGRAIRDRLIPDYSSCSSSDSSETKQAYRINTSIGFQNSEMEYQIRIGSKNITGKLPLSELSSQNMIKAIEKYEANLYPVSTEEEYDCLEAEAAAVSYG